MRQREGEAHHLANLGIVCREMGNLRDALGYQDRALSVAEEIEQPEVKWRVRSGRSRTNELLGDVQAAVADLKVAVEDIERVRGNLRQHEERLSFFGEKKPGVYVQLVELLHSKLGFEGEALEYVERAKSRSFLDLLQQQNVHITTESEGKPVRFEEVVSLTATP